MNNLLYKIIPTNAIWFNLILAFFIVNSMAAQNTTKEAAKARAQQAIETLKDGLLVVRLTSNQKKINKLEELIATKDISARNRQNLEQELANTLAQTKARNILLMEKFRALYNFSDVLFMYDTDTDKLLAKQESGYFLNKKLEVSSSLSLQESPFLILRFGTTDRATTAGIEGMIITDSELKDLNPPFPYAYKEGGFMFVFDKVFDPQEAAVRNYPRIIEKLNIKLKKYYREVN